MYAIDKGIIARWKIDTKFENWLSKQADKSEGWKKVYIQYYNLFDHKYYINGRELAKKEIEKRKAIPELNEKDQIDDMIYSLHRFGCTFDEYYSFEFYNKNHIGRKSYLTDKVRFEYSCLMDSEADSKILSEKTRTYELFGKYFKRDFIAINGAVEEARFLEFVNKHSRFIYKKSDECCGRGINIIELKPDDSAEELFEKLIQEGTFVCEEIIVQSDVMGKFHEPSVNTVRIPIVNCDGEICVISPFFRMGHGGSIVDNAGSGGGLCCC